MIGRIMFIASSIVLVMVLCAPSVVAAGSDSIYQKMSVDTLISSTLHTPLLTSTITFASPRNVLVFADGRYLPNGINGIAIVTILIDGSSKWSNESKIDWRESTATAQHGFNCIAAATLGAGTHTFQLAARNGYTNPAGRFIVGAGSGLGVMTDPAPQMQSVRTLSSIGVNVSTVNLPEGAINTPVTILSNTVNTTTPSQVITLASGTASRTSASGDSLWGIFLNGACPTMSETLWSVNDLAYGAEVMAPMYSHALNYVNGDNTITLQAGELAWGLGREDPVIYSVLPMTRLISLWGNSITGGAPISSRECSSLEYTCVGTSVGWGGCPDAGTPVEIASASINIPEGHNGVLAFLAKTRVQAHTYDSGNVLLFLSIDDVEVGGGGVQQIVSPEGISSRTLSASYLSAGEGRLLPGNHIVRVFAQANGSFRHLCTTNDLPLVFFD